MTSVHSESIRPDARTLHPTGTTRPKVGRGGAVRLVVGTLAILVLVALGSLDPRSTIWEPTASDAAVLVGSDAAPVYDGWGKWGGYTD